MSDSTLPRKRRRLTGCVEPCRECGNQIGQSSYGAGFGHRIKRWRICFNCDVWLGVLGDMYVQAGEFKLRNGQPIVSQELIFIIGGYAYSISKKDPMVRGRGFGGREGRFMMLDGGITYASRNVWCRGEVPAHFRDRMPDTAEWVSGYDLTPIKMGA